jgi:ubiquinone/menaquinone biosynthesis C-methylase UbiE
MFHPKGPTFFELARQALSSTEHGYDLLAPKFDYTPFRTPDAILRAVASQIGPPKSLDTALDVCCGTGAAMQMLRSLCRDRVVGIDVSQRMLEIGRQRSAAAPGDAPLEFLRGNVFEMPLVANFDVAVCLGALGHILREDQPQFVEQIYRVLKPGGRFFFVTSYMPPLSSFSYWAARGFNAAMHVRNALFSPPFIMYYLTFVLPQAEVLLQQHGFDVQVADGVFHDRFSRLRLVIAARR